MLSSPEARDVQGHWLVSGFLSFFFFFSCTQQLNEQSCLKRCVICNSTVPQSWAENSIPVPEMDSCVALMGGSYWTDNFSSSCLNPVMHYDALRLLASLLLNSSTTKLTLHYNKMNPSLSIRLFFKLRRQRTPKLLSQASFDSHSWLGILALPTQDSLISLPHFKDASNGFQYFFPHYFPFIFVSLTGFVESKYICMVLISHMVTSTSFWCVLLWNSILL